MKMLWNIHSIALHPCLRPHWNNSDKGNGIKCQRVDASLFELLKWQKCHRWRRTRIITHRAAENWPNDDNRRKMKLLFGSNIDWTPKKNFSKINAKINEVLPPIHRFDHIRHPIIHNKTTRTMEMNIRLPNTSYGLRGIQIYQYCVANFSKCVPTFWTHVCVVIGRSIFAYDASTRVNERPFTFGLKFIIVNDCMRVRVRVWVRCGCRIHMVQTPSIIHSLDYFKSK